MLNNIINLNLFFMKLYKLLKDLPLVKAGRIVELEKSNWGLDIYTIF